MGMSWHVLRNEEGRGFVSKRIFRIIIDIQMMIWGTCFYEDYDSIKRILTPDEIFKQNTQ